MLLSLGILLLLIDPIQSYFINRSSNQLHIRDYTIKEIQSNETQKTTFQFEDIQPLSIMEVLRAQASLKKMPVIGSIVIPSVRMQLPILKGVSNHTLTVGAGTMKPHQKLGAGNYALAGHYFEDTTILFGPLYQTKLGDTIYITDLSNIYEYTISTKKIIKATDIYVINDIPHQTILTLITCAEAGTKRLAVRANFTAQYPFHNAPQKLRQAFDRK